MAKTIFGKIIKSIAYASAGGAIAIGAGTINLVDADFLTIVYTVICAVIFNFFKEISKSLLENGE